MVVSRSSSDSDATKVTAARTPDDSDRLVVLIVGPIPELPTSNQVTADHATDSTSETHSSNEDTSTHDPPKRSRC